MPRDSFCSYCGQAFARNQPWPRQCTPCGNITYRNPLPVAVTLVPVDDGVLTVRRDIEPQRGKLALPGGYVDFRETWQQAAVREVHEETGLELSLGEIREFGVHSSADGVFLLVFGLASPRTESQLPPFLPNGEATERVILRAAEELAFPLHTWAIEEFFRQR